MAVASIIISALSLILAITVALFQYRTYKRSLWPSFEIKQRNLYAEHFNFVIHNSNSQPISIYKVDYPSGWSIDDKQIYSEEFGAVVLEDLGVEIPMELHVYYNLKNNKKRKANIELVRNNQSLFIQRQMHKKL